MSEPARVAAVLLVDLAAIVAVAHVLRRVLARFGQPTVIAEILAGVLLGPTILGSASSTLFPADARPALALIGQLGLMGFMFLVGVDLQLRSMPSRRVVSLIGAGSVLVPFACGIAIAPHLFAAYPTVETSRPGAVLFLGVALSITAFPVLARILRETRLDGTPIGTTALASAALNDVAGWSLLAVVIAMLQTGGAGGGIRATAGTLLFACGMLIVVRPLLARHRPHGWRAASLAIAAILVCGWITNRLGTHAIFGPFLLGVAWPRGFEGTGTRELDKVLGPITRMVLLPLFFATPGLTVDLRSLVPADAGELALILVAATVAKIAGAAGGAALAGLPRRAAATIGVLMNTRGLMELVVLNVGYELGLLAPRLYALLVIMAITTTLMTAPLLRRAGAVAGVSGDRSRARPHRARPGDVPARRTA